MPERDLTDRSSVRELAKRIGQRPAVPVKMTGSTTPGGRDRDTRIVGLPLPIGDEGQVLAIVDVGGDLIPQWVDAPSVPGVSGQYHQYVLISDGVGGFEFVDDGFGNPVTTLEDLV